MNKRCDKPRESISPPLRPLSVCVAYHDIRAWRESWRLLETLREIPDVEFKVFWFSFAELSLFLKRAARIAAQADLVVVTTSQHNSDLLAVRHWLHRFRDLDQHQPGALVGLISDVDRSQAVCPWEGLLKESAGQSGRDLFLRATQMARNPTPGTPSTDKYLE